MELGRRAGAALEKVRLYDERDAVAQILQRSLLPPEFARHSRTAARRVLRPRRGRGINACGGEGMPVGLLPVSASPPSKSSWKQATRW
jgi:hypothetical protein